MVLIIMLILAGILLVLAEIFLIPGVGVAGILGLLSLCASSVLAFSAYGTVTGTIITIANCLLLAGFTIYCLRAKTWKKLALKTNIDSRVSNFDETKLSVGDKGRAMTRLAPMGTAIINGRKYEVKALTGIINPDEKVEVVMIEDNKIYVKLPDIEF